MSGGYDDKQTTSGILRAYTILLQLVCKSGLQGGCHALIQKQVEEHIKKMLQVVKSI